MSWASSSVSTERPTQYGETRIEAEDPVLAHRLARAAWQGTEGTPENGKSHERRGHQPRARPRRSRAGADRQAAFARRARVASAAASSSRFGTTGSPGQSSRRRQAPDDRRPRPRRRDHAATARPARSPEHGRSSAPTSAAPAVPTKFEVEARTLALLQQREVARSAPAGVLDQRSGLLATSAYLVCARVGRASVFDCRLGVGYSPGRTWLLTVAVAGDGTEKLTWNGSVVVP